MAYDATTPLASTKRSTSNWNQLFLCAVNGCGTIGRVQSTGHSAVYDPWGTNLLEMDTNEGIASVDIDLAVVEDIRNKINIFRDRKPELYNL